MFNSGLYCEYILRNLFKNNHGLLDLQSEAQHEVLQLTVTLIVGYVRHVLQWASVETQRKWWEPLIWTNKALLEQSTISFDTCKRETFWQPFEKKHCTKHIGHSLRF